MDELVGAQLRLFYPVESTQGLRHVRWFIATECHSLYFVQSSNALQHALSLSTENSKNSEELVKIE